MGERMYLLHSCRLGIPYRKEVFFEYGIFVVNPNFFTCVRYLRTNLSPTSVKEGKIKKTLNILLAVCVSFLALMVLGAGILIVVDSFAPTDEEIGQSLGVELTTDIPDFNGIPFPEAKHGTCCYTDGGGHSVLAGTSVTIPMSDYPKAVAWLKDKNADQSTSCSFEEFAYTPVPSNAFDASSPLAFGEPEPPCEWGNEVNFYGYDGNDLTISTNGRMTVNGKEYSYSVKKYINDPEHVVLNVSKWGHSS